MGRAAIFLALSWTLAGCGEPDRPRFTPASPGVSAPSKVPPGDPTREATPPKNIATH